MEIRYYKLKLLLVLVINDRSCFTVRAFSVRVFERHEISAYQQRVQWAGSRIPIGIIDLWGRVNLSIVVIIHVHLLLHHVPVAYFHVHSNGMPSSVVDPGIAMR